MKWGRTVVIAALTGMLAAMPGLAAEDDIHARADKVSGQIKGKGRDVVKLEGNVRIAHGRTEILGEQAVYDKEAGILTVQGNVSLSHEGIRVDADELIYQRRTKEGTFRGRVRLAREEEKDESGRTTKDAFTITSDELVFAAEQKSFAARGGAAMEHREFSARAEEIIYDDAHQELQLSGSPSLTHGDERILGEQILISVEGDSFKILKAEITFMVGDENGGGEAGEEEAGEGAGEKGEDEADGEGDEEGGAAAGGEPPPAG